MFGGGNIGPLPHIPAVAAAAPFGRFIKCCSRYRAAIMETAVGIEQHHAVSEHLYTPEFASQRDPRHSERSQDPTTTPHASVSLSRDLPIIYFHVRKSPSTLDFSSSHPSDTLHTISHLLSSPRTTSPFPQENLSEDSPR